MNARTLWEETGTDADSRTSVTWQFKSKEDAQALESVHLANFHSRPQRRCVHHEVEGQVNNLKVYFIFLSVKSEDNDL